MVTLAAFILCIWLLCCSYVCVAQKPEEDVGSVGIQLTDGCESNMSAGYQNQFFGKTTSASNHWGTSPFSSYYNLK